MLMEHLGRAVGLSSELQLRHTFASQLTMPYYATVGPYYRLTTPLSLRRGKRKQKKQGLNSHFSLCSLC